MKREPIHINDISIRTNLRPGDLGFVIHRHGRLYEEEYGYGTGFEMYVAAGLGEFYKSYDPLLDRVWVCEHHDRIIGFLLLMHRAEDSAQLRYFYLERDYRGIGLGKKLINLFFEFLREKGYRLCYLWTTNEQKEAAALYARYGFTLTEEKTSLAFGKPLTEQKYEVRLSGK